jgi:hypothetical protein
LDVSRLRGLSEGAHQGYLPSAQFSSIVTDWDRVRRLREKGWDWTSIAEDPKVHFTAPQGVSDPGRALKALYQDRKSKAQRTGRPMESPTAPVARPARERWRPGVVILGFALLIAGAIWLVVAYFYTSLRVIVGLFPPQFPDILMVALLGAILLVGIWITGWAPLRASLGKGIAAGIVAGIIVVGAVGYAAYAASIPNLNPNATPDTGSGWEKASNSVWTTSGKPVVFFYGSQACPYCSASSWAIAEALQAFGTLSGTTNATSSPTDTFPNTPEIALSSSSLQSAYVSWDPREDPYTATIHLPTLSSVEQAYVSVYDSCSTCGIPFFVVGGVYMHIGTIVNPQALVDPQTQTAYSPSEVQADMTAANPSDPVYSAIHGAAVYIEAYMAKICELYGITPPASVTSDSQVASILAQIY